MHISSCKQYTTFFVIRASECEHVFVDTRGHLLYPIRPIAQIEIKFLQLLNEFIHLTTRCSNESCFSFRLALC